MRSGPRYGRSSASSTASTSRRRQLFRTYTRGDPVNASLHNVINGRMGFKDYLFAGVDSLNATIDQALSEDKREMSKEKTRADAQVLNPGSNRSSELNETLGPKSCTAFS